MGERDPRIDEYIARSADFAKPILAHLRELVHEHCPEVEEKVKWSSPHFDHRGPMAHMAAFKQHCAFGFWKGAMVVGDTEREGAGQFGKIASLADLPPDHVLAGYIRAAKELNESGTSAPARARKMGPKPELPVPAFLVEALEGNPRARRGFEGLAPGQRREYVEWLSEARSDATRARRLNDAVEWMAEGKPRHWKYMKS